jgi:hypothetical protein
MYTITCQLLVFARVYKVRKSWEASPHPEVLKATSDLFRIPNPISSAATPSIYQFVGSGGSSVTIYQSYCAVSLSHLDCILFVHYILPGQTPCELHSHALRSCYEEYLSKCLGSFEALSIHLVT